MKNQKEILSWLKANCGRRALAALTSHDTDALCASVALTPLISYEAAPPALFAAYGAVVNEMQPQTRHLAFHAIAMELDWGHRFMIWAAAGLSEDDKPTSPACFETGGGGQQRSDQLNQR